MRVRPVWIVLAVLFLPPVLLVIGWRTLPRARAPGRCSSVSAIAPSERDAVAFSSALRSAILDNPGGPFQLHTTDDQLTSYVAIETQGHQLADPQIHFLDGAVCLSGRVVGLGLVRPRFHAEVHSYIVNGDIQFNIRSLIVNGRRLPGWMRCLAQRVANESIHDASLPIWVEAVQVRDGAIVITGERLSRPR
ncbi:MAG: hypothetical protein MAG451_00503 [Anaerolineales bacterium]|nr:hypothetical protein [Anaerolineales bacterium]